MKLATLVLRLYLHLIRTARASGFRSAVWLCARPMNQIWWVWCAQSRNPSYSTQSPDLHFRNLVEHKKKPVCDALAAAELRMFVVVSNKKNMRKYRNPQAEAVSLHPNNWFYNYCIRILLERLSEWCATRSIKETEEPKHVKLVFSRRGGHYIGTSKHIRNCWPNSRNRTHLSDRQSPRFSRARSSIDGGNRPQQERRVSDRGRRRQFFLSSRKCRQQAMEYRVRRSPYASHRLKHSRLCKLWRHTSPMAELGASPYRCSKENLPILRLPNMKAAGPGLVTIGGL